MKKNIGATFGWIKDNVLAVLIASFIVPGVLAVFNQQSEITKAIYETDYKSVKAKFQECDGLHSEYLSAAATNAGTALILQKYFNLDAIAKNESSEAYALAFKATMETYRKSLEQVSDLFTRASRCYGQLTASYENLALSLDLVEEFQDKTKQGADEIAILVAKRDAITEGLSKKFDLNTVFGELILGDEQSISAAMRRVNYDDLAKIQSKNVEVASAVQNQQRAQYVELNKLFAGELSRRFHRGLFSYFGSLFGI